MGVGIWKRPQGDFADLASLVEGLEGVLLLLGTPKDIDSKRLQHFGELPILGSMHEGNGSFPK